MSEAGGEGLAVPDLIRAMIAPPDSGREAPDAEYDAFVKELQTLMNGIEEVARRGKLALLLTVEFRGGTDPDLPENRLGFTFSTED